MIEKPTKDPKVPVFPHPARMMYDALNVIVSAGGDLSPLAYGAMTRLCVLWSDVKLVGETQLGGGMKVELVNDLVKNVAQLFPDVEELPGEDGYRL